MSYSSIRDLVVSTLTSVSSDIGTIHPRVRYSNNWTSFLALFQHEMSDGSGPRIKGWMVTRTANAPDIPSSSFGSTTRTYVFLLRGILAFHDGSELYNSDDEWQEDLDLIVSALDDLRDLTSADGSVVIESGGPCTVRTSELRMFGQILAHYGEIEFPLQVHE